MNAITSLHRPFGHPTDGTGWDGRRGAFGAARTLVNDHPLVADAVVAAGVFLSSLGWLVQGDAVTLESVLLTVSLTLPLVWRRTQPSVVFAVLALVALAQWLLDVRLFADLALLVALYTVVVRQSRARIVGAVVLLEVGVVLAASRWELADTEPRSIVFLTGLAAAALCAGLAVRSGSQYLAWMDERASRLELERDQRAAIGTAQERARIAREMHDIVAHSLSVVVTLADAASVTVRTDPPRAEETMRQAAEVGRQALGDMRTVLSALRTEGGEADLGPQPGLDDLDALYDRVRQTGLTVLATVSGTAVDFPAPLELSVYRIVQEALTNVIKHAEASTIRVHLSYDAASVEVRVEDDGRAPLAPMVRTGDGHGLTGMSERANLHEGVLHAGPSPRGGWAVSTRLRADTSLARPVAP